MIFNCHQIQSQTLAYSIDKQNVILDLKKQEFEMELDEKIKLFEDGLRNILTEVAKKEGEVNHMEENVSKRREDLGK